MQTEHPFAQYVRILGKGHHGSRNFTQDEAREVMRMILANEVTPEQLGAVLMLMRVKEETPEEVAGFVQAIRETLTLPEQLPAVQLDWSSYAGKRRHLPWFILAALLLAENGITIFMHGASGHTAGRIYTKDVLALLGIQTSQSLKQSVEQLEKENFSYLDIEHLSPKLHQLIELRPFLGLRSPVHTVARMINPFNAPYLVTGIHHPGYHPTHQLAARLLGQPHTAVVKGEGGEIERNPDMTCLVKTLHGEIMKDENWPAMFARRHVKPKELKPRDLAAVWQDDQNENEYGLAAVIGTTAIILKLMEKADSMDDAEILAREMWEKRSREKFSTAA